MNVRRLRQIGAIFAIILATIGVVRWLRQSPVRVASAKPKVTERALDAPANTPQQADQSDPPDIHFRGPRPRDPNKPTIALAKVEKAEVCRGEENFLDVEAHTENGTDAFLTVSFHNPVSGQLVRGGSRIPFRLDKPSERGIDVLVEGGHATSSRIELPAVKVKDCDAPLQVDVKHSRTMEAPDRVTFSAQIKEFADPLHAARAPFLASEFEWDFGDGEQQRTNEPTIEHSYEARDQGRSQSSFLVTVKARDAHGLEASGTHGVVFVNLGFPRLVYQDQVALSMGSTVADAGHRKPQQR